MENQVCLLSREAEDFLVKKSAQNAKTGFWAEIQNFFSKQEKGIIVEAAPFEGLSEEVMAPSGFFPFCRIREVKTFVKTKDNRRVIAIFENGKPWDISEWGTGSDFKIRVIAEFYFMVTKDDFKIDSNEANVLLALFNCLDPSAQEIQTAKEMVYWTLVENVMEDGIVTDEEQEIMQKIRIAFDLSEKEQKELHVKAIEKKFDELLSSGEKPLQKGLDDLIEMGRRLGIEDSKLKALAERAVK